MPPVRRQNIGRRTSDTRRVYNRRSNETEEERTQRLEETRMQISQARSQNRRSNVTIIYERLAFRYDPRVDYAADKSVDFGTMSTVCQYCNALRFRLEPPGLCCASGKVKLPQLIPPPEPLNSLLSGQEPLSMHFLQNIQKYNSVFQMTSFGANIIEERGFNPTFKVSIFFLLQYKLYYYTKTHKHHTHPSHHTNVKIILRLINEEFMFNLQIQGQIHHRAGALLPPVNDDHKFLQIYFLGNSDAEVNQRCAINRAAKREIIMQLQQLLHEHNQLVQLFKTALEMMPSDDHKIVIRADKRPAGEHERRFNAPMLNEVAIVVVGENLKSRDIVIQRRDGGNLQRICETHRSYDGLQYPLIFCRGEDGYHFLIKMINPLTGMYQCKLKTTKSSNNPSVVVINCFSIQFLTKLFFYSSRNKQKGQLDEFLCLSFDGSSKRGQPHFEMPEIVSSVRR